MLPAALAAGDELAVISGQKGASTITSSPGSVSAPTVAPSAPVAPAAISTFPGPVGTPQIVSWRRAIDSRSGSSPRGGA